MPRTKGLKGFPGRGNGLSKGVEAMGDDERRGKQFGEGLACSEFTKERS